MRRSFLLAALVAGCTSSDPERTPNEPAENWQPRIPQTALQIDVDALEGRAELGVSTLGEGAVSLWTGGLDVGSVEIDGFPELGWVVDDDRLDVALPHDVAEATVIVEYSFDLAGQFEGLMAGGSTLTWPYHCDNLFPCRPHPSEGTRFLLDVTSAQDLVFAEDTMGVAPAYQMAWAAGEYVRTELGVTPAGTVIEAWAPPGAEAAVAAGTDGLVDVFGWLEQTLGPYAFGPRAGAVQVEWGPGAIGGMEHHPLWHVSAGAMDDPIVQAHEAAHGWFGAEVRLACWEDLVLSEGVATWLAARAIGATAGAEAEAEVWEDYRAELRGIVDGPLNRDLVVWPDSCGEVDVLDGGLFTRATYLKGAWFLRQVSEASSTDAVERAVAAVVASRGGQAAGMQDLVDALEVETGLDLSELVTQWLRTEGAPEGWDEET
ncbi:MAG: peptidase M1 [Deltaproteobacteria bacterium]|nr:peptidase M1 [Deltaproteobacteria bacterium]